VAFGSREEYERWKGQRASGNLPPLPPGTAPHAAAGIRPEKKKQGFAQMFEGLPRWAWLFGGACPAIPVVSMGGAIPAAIGFGGASLCGSIAKKQEKSPGARAALCAVVTAAAWGLFIGVLAIIGGLRQG
jgi:hypothetical protein